MVKHLWEVEHPYHCHEASYHDSSSKEHHETWQSFFEEWFDADEDYNLLFRWDIYFHEGDEEKQGGGWPENCEEATLHLYFVMQRKAYTYSVTVKIKKDDELKVRDYLQGKLNYLVRMWEPLTPGTVFWT